MKRFPKIVDWGLSDYRTVYDRMRSFTSERSEDSKDEIWFCEHKPVYTVGASSPQPMFTQINNIPVISTDRGGKITYHGPGQLVCYPLFNLNHLGIYPKEFLLLLEKILLNTLQAFGVKGVLIEKCPGVFVEYQGGSGQFEGLAKIVSIGLKISRHCTYHGFSLNVNMDLSPFSKINPCGYQGLRLINLKELCPSADIFRVKSIVSEKLLDTASEH